MRVTLWLSGCSHHCKGCQNPQTWAPNSGILFDEKAKEELFLELDKDYISGLTLSGGDPLNENNLNEVLNICRMFKEKFPQKNIWIYTGYTWMDLTLYDSYSKCIELKKYIENYELYKQRHDIISLCDVLVDGKYIENMMDVSLEWRGSSNQRIIDIQKSLKENKIILWEAG